MNLQHISDKISVIVPRRHLNLVKDDARFMALAHIADECPDYLQFFKARVAEGKYVILDNSTVELGEPMDFDRYIQIALEMSASEVVLPDYFRDSKRTLEAIQPSIAALRDAGYYGKFMVAPQGVNSTEWLGCAIRMLRHPLIHTIGISCRYTGMFGNRCIAINSLIPHMAFSFMTLHLLGCYLDPKEEAAMALRSYFVSGIDSSTPSVFAKHDMWYGIDGYTRPARTNDFINDWYNETQLEANIRVWRKRCNGLG